MEGSLGWKGDSRFMGFAATEGAAPNSATFYTLIGNNWLTESGVWVEAPRYTSEGQRMFWLRNYNDPDTICVGQRFTNSTATGSQLVPGRYYQLSWDFAAFNPDAPFGDARRFSRPLMEVMSWNPAASRWDVVEIPLLFSNGTSSDPNQGLFQSFALGDWKALEWHTARAYFQAPAATGQPVFLWASMTGDSQGMLLDNIRLVSIPEPSGLMLPVLACLTLLHRQRRPSGK